MMDQQQIQKVQRNRAYLNAIHVHAYISLNNGSHGFWKFHFNSISCTHCINGFSAFVLNFKCVNRYTCMSPLQSKRSSIFFCIHSDPTPNAHFVMQRFFIVFCLLLTKHTCKIYIYVYIKKLLWAACRRGYVYRRIFQHKEHKMLCSLCGKKGKKENQIYIYHMPD